MHNCVTTKVTTRVNNLIPYNYIINIVLAMSYLHVDTVYLLNNIQMKHNFL